jgi:hypothetical protein
VKKLIESFKLALPNREHFPSIASQATYAGTVSADVVVDLSIPVLFIALRPMSNPAARMEMPEATVDQDYLLVAWQDNVRASGQIPPMNPKPITHVV